MKVQQTLHRRNPPPLRNVTPIRRVEPRTVSNEKTIEINQTNVDMIKDLNNKIATENQTRKYHENVIGNLQSRVKELTGVVNSVQELNIDELKPDISGIEAMIDRKLSGLKGPVERPTSGPTPSIIGGTKENKSSRFDIVRDDAGRITSVIQMDQTDES